MPTDVESSPGEPRPSTRPFVLWVVEWSHNPGSHYQLEVLGDSLSVIRWVRGRCLCQRPELRRLLEHVLDIVLALVRDGVRARANGTELMCHAFRELNADAGSLAGRRETMKVVHRDARPSEYYRMHFDGRYDAGRGVGGLGWLLEGGRVPTGADGNAMEDSLQWVPIAHGSHVLSRLTSSIRAELHAPRVGLAFFFSLVGDRGAGVVQSERPHPLAPP